MLPTKYQKNTSEKMDVMGERDSAGFKRWFFCGLYTLWGPLIFVRQQLYVSGRIGIHTMYKEIIARSVSKVSGW